MDPVIQSNPKIEAILRRVRDIPTLPTMVDRILEKLNLPSASAAEVAKLISYDPGLTSKFLRIVNSAAYGFQRQISSIQHAIMILGFGQVRGIVLSTSIVKLFAGGKTSGGLNASEFWQHSLQTAVVARALAERNRIPYAEDAFSAGILHDIGKITLDAYFGSEYATVVAAANKQHLPPHGLAYLNLERTLMGLDHAEMGYCLAIRWRLPLTFKEVIRFHHHPTHAKDAPALVYTVALANAFSYLLLHNDGVFDDTWIAPDILAFFNYDPNAPEPFMDLYTLACEQMASVEELMAVIRS